MITHRTDDTTFGYRSTAAAIAAMCVHVPIPILPLSEFIGRKAGTGGGGIDSAGGVTPHFCRCCGKTVSKKKVKPSCDVCARCRSRGGR